MDSRRSQLTIRTNYTLLFLLAFWTFALLPAPTVRAQSESHAANSASAESFCEQFEAITNAAPLFFKPLRGKFEFIDEWKGKQALPGTANCIAFGRRGDASYMCSTPIVEGEARVKELFDTLKSQVQKCLGSGWTANDYTNRRGDPGTGFWKDRAAYDVHVAVKSQAGRADKAEITLTVSRP